MISLGGLTRPAPVPVAVVGSAEKAEVGLVGAAAKRIRADVVYLDQMARVAAPPGLPIDVPATAFVALPDLPPGGGRDGAPRRAWLPRRSGSGLRRRSGVRRLPHGLLRCRSGLQVAGVLDLGERVVAAMCLSAPFAVEALSRSGAACCFAVEVRLASSSASVGRRTLAPAARWPARSRSACSRRPRVVRPRRESGPGSRRCRRFRRSSAPLSMRACGSLMSSAQIRWFMRRICGSMWSVAMSSGMRSGSYIRSGLYMRLNGIGGARGGCGPNNDTKSN